MPPSHPKDRLYEHDEESLRLEEDLHRVKNWKRWGPYLSERQWATVREDYSDRGDTWGYFPHDHARSRAYRWGEDGLLGFTDRQCRLCFALALWNEKDGILKERLFGLTGPEGNHGEDVKELYYYVDSTPTYSYAKALYKYPQAAFPYAQLLEGAKSRGLADPEYELLDTGVFDEGRYFDVQIEYAKADDEDMLVLITVTNRGPERAPLHVLPTLWFRNTWAWGRDGEGYGDKPTLGRHRTLRGSCACVWAEHGSLGRYELAIAPTAGPVEVYFTENETNLKRLYGSPNASRFVKDAFHERVIHGRTDAVNPDEIGTKAAMHVRMDLAPGETRVLRLRLFDPSRHLHGVDLFDESFERAFEARRTEADRFFEHRTCGGLGEDERRAVRQARAGLLFSKQFYHYVVKDWLEGDPAFPAPSPDRDRNRDWGHLYNRDIISMPDKWEYPWYAAWDTQRST